MSTNFYLIQGHRETGDCTCEHIGKRSAGWAFTFQGRNHKTRAEWERRLEAMGYAERIEDEYGRPYTREEFLAAVDDTLKPWGPAETPPRVKDGDVVIGGRFYERDRTRNWVESGCSFSAYEFS